MASTYSTNLKIELMGTGDQSGTWGNTTNTNLGTALEQAIVGYGNPNFTTDADLTITLTDSNASQTARAFALNVTSGVSLSTTRNLIVPTIQKPYLIYNNTSGSQSIIVKTSAGSGVTVANGARTLVYVDGTNVVSSVSNLPALTLNTALAATSGGTGNSSYAVGDLLYASTTTALAKLADVATGNALISGGVGVAPSYGKIGLTTHVSGILPIANGGTNSSSATYCNLTTNVTGTLPVANGGTGITSFGTGVATALGQNVTGSGGIALATSPALTTPDIGTPSAGTLTNCTGLPLTGTTGTLAVDRGGTGQTTYTNGQLLIGNTTGNTLTKATLTAGTGITITNGTGSITIAGNTGTVTSVGGTGTVNGITLTGTVTSTGNLTLGGTLSGVSLTTQVTGTLPVANGGSGATTLTGVLKGNGTSAFTASNVNLASEVTGTLPVANGGTGLATLTANNLLLGNGTSAPTFISPSTSGNILQADGTTWASSPKIVLSTAQATTSGVEKEFTSIPSWVKRITMMFDAVSTNGSSDIIIQLGSTTYTTTGYDSAVAAILGGTSGSNSNTSGFLIVVNLSTYSVSGVVTINLMGSNTWAYSSSVRYTTSGMQIGAGRVALSGTLDRIKLLTSNGTDAFDAGTVNIMYE